MLKITSKRRFASTKQFQIMHDRKIGCGSFGVVHLARHRSTCRMYALKIIDLKNIPSQTELRLVQRQIRIHLDTDHPHIIKLWDAIPENEHIYMVMEYAEQGNLFYHQNTKSVFSEAETYKFFAQTLSGIKYLHQQNVIHRDLKPENLLLDAQHNIKICDFGWCAEDIMAKRSTFCGTYEYMAPEMLFKSEYDYRVDIWALGILLYEMLHGYAPFKGKSAADVQEAMLKGHYQFANQLSAKVKRLINQILQFQPDKRLSIEEILQHPWMIEMESYLNNYLTNQNTVLPKDIQTKISFAPPMTPVIRPKAGDGSKRRKNNSLNFQETSHNININLEINNFSIMGKQNKSKNNYHSQQKQRQIQQFCSLNGAFDQQNPSHLKKNKMKPTNTTQTDIDMNKVIQKVKSVRSAKLLLKQLPILQKQKRKHEPLHQTGSKKKLKLRRSEVQMHEKHPIRFNTEANQKDQWCCQPPKLKKATATKNKLLASSKSMLRLHKS